MCVRAAKHGACDDRSHSKVHDAASSRPGSSIGMFGMPSCHVREVAPATRARPEVLRVIIEVQMMRLHEPHQMHGIDLFGGGDGDLWSLRDMREITVSTASSIVR